MFAIWFSGVARGGSVGNCPPPPIAENSWAALHIAIAQSTVRSVGKWNIWVMRCGSFTSGNTYRPPIADSTLQGLHAQTQTIWVQISLEAGGRNSPTNGRCNRLNLTLSIGPRSAIDTCQTIYGHAYWKLYIAHACTWCAAKRLQLNVDKIEIPWFGSAANLRK